VSTTLSVRTRILIVFAIVMAARPAVAQLPVCADSLPFTGDTTGVGYVAPRPTQIVVPPVGFPKSMHNGFLEVRFLVNTAGIADTAEVVGFVDPKYQKTLRKSLGQYRFAPARMPGCRRQGWYTLQMTLGPRGGPPPSRTPWPRAQPLPPAPVPPPPPRP
jgi:hypothetical protein